MAVLAHNLIHIHWTSCKSLSIHYWLTLDVFNWISNWCLSLYYCGLENWIAFLNFQLTLVFLSFFCIFFDYFVPHFLLFLSLHTYLIRRVYFPCLTWSTYLSIWSIFYHSDWVRNDQILWCLLSQVDWSRIVMFEYNSKLFQKKSIRMKIFYVRDKLKFENH